MNDSPPAAALLAPDTVTRYGAPSLRVKRLDLHTRLFLKMIRASIKKWKSELPTVDKVRPPRMWGEMTLKQLPFGSAGAQLHLPTVDEDWPAADWKRTAILSLLRNDFLFPIKDPADEWVSAEEARDTFQEVLPLGSFMSRPYHYWKEMHSDAAMSRIAFAGLGALRVMPYTHSEGEPAELAGAAWQHDMTFLGNYAVRKPFERYGARAVFDAEQHPVAIYWCEGREWVLRPAAGEDAAKWSHAKWAWRCSLMVGTTVADHLVGVHWLIANYVTTAARNKLSPTHYLRLLLKPFTWRTVTINAGAADSLCPKNGFVHRASALEYDALTQAFGDSVGLMRFHTVPQLVARKGVTVPDARFPWLTDALALYNVIHRFVDEYVSAYATEEEILADIELNGFWTHLNEAPATVMFPGRSREGLIDVISQFIWSVTGLHEAVGTVHEYVLDPTFMGTKIRPGKEMADVQASMQYLLIMALTGLQMPKLMDLGDAAGVFDADMKGRKAFAKFHAELSELSVQIDAANALRLKDERRPWPCETFNPKNLETGVSI
ncbi:hypothetical protein LBMAG42_31110 [Deltaproteobacteria bacterium]|nr:hypothetical protein LBMAG42_31110 [Deltaproteobacteria bacterium]